MVSWRETMSIDRRAKREARTVPVHSEAAVTTRALGVGYGKELIVADIDLNLPKGEVLALVGSNGSGKTTLLRTIAGLLKPIAGSLEVLGEPPLTQPGRVAYMGQFHPSSFMLPLRAIDVVRMSRFAAHGLLGHLTDEDESAVGEAIDLMGLSRIAMKPLNTLSGGQRQRVFIAQALAHEAELILLDEPATNIDAKSREIYRGFIRDAANLGVSTIIATHDIEEAAACDQTLLLAHRVVAYGKSEDVLTAETLLSTFGIVGRYKEGRIVVVDREHGHDCD
jgi:ABC-type Mn2+/Zn2+ transport system ATPase subunit